ncbi:hypothetical protein BAUCODRAFT_30691 [Baudoinia panamericana UAMH 10762]|uniref:Uncharacterized protein n=1 Tax=Baudoinia panamericana (strain UAMH 10762) TaxID=717646 RepID=M2MTI8_BAUPA|nr:uncharacterized protein BAUCODRAFT_30691 [Baudoinia panamericana UAMH 10762]EMD00222.1 hypothetical protein BAUCODRAFT_30691 [Baudoinia panamericana UAMH 10762]
MATHLPKLSDRPRNVNTGKAVIGYGSDAIAEQLSRLHLDYIALVPGSSYRGLHDSLVNYNGNAKPEMLVCLHEEHAVSIAHGYAKVAEKPMAVGLHANVGLMHATMAIFNAWCDRVPMLILGATGPLDATRRRPWIDWAHTAQDQGALVRQFVKWDDQPHSVNAAIASVVHATVATSAKPCAPTYVCFDLSLQEDEIDPETVHLPDTERYLHPVHQPPGPSPDEVLRVIDALHKSKRPLFMFGRMNGWSNCWQERIQLAERFDALVLTDIKQAATFPTNHTLHPCPPSVFITSQACGLIRSADVIVSFDWVDLAGTLKAAHDVGQEPAATVVHVSMDSALHNGWSKDHFGLPPADISIYADVDRTLTAVLTSTMGEIHSSEWSKSGQTARNHGTPAAPESKSEDIFMTDLASALHAAIPSEDICLVRVPLGWKGADLRATHPLAFMGMDGGAGIASGPGQAVGTALALRDVAPNLLAVGVLGDGDFLMGSSALWTAARYRLPLLVVVANNGSYFNDEVHQERVAKRRGREVDNKWIGMRLEDPTPDVHMIAQGLGCVAVVEQQVTQRSKLAAVLKDAAAQAFSGKAVVVDVRVLPEGYASAMKESK